MRFLHSGNTKHSSTCVSDAAEWSAGSGTPSSAALDLPFFRHFTEKGHSAKKLSENASRSCLKEKKTMALTKIVAVQILKKTTGN